MGLKACEMSSDESHILSLRAFRITSLILRCISVTRWHLFDWIGNLPLGENRLFVKVDAVAGQRVEVVKQHFRVDNHSVAHQTLGPVFLLDAVGQQMNLVAIVQPHRVRGGSAIEADGVVVVFAEFVEDLVLALLAPLDSKNHAEPGLDAVVARHLVKHLLGQILHLIIIKSQNKRDPLRM